REALRRGRIDQVGIPARDRTEFFRFWSRPEARRSSRIAKPQRARREKRLRIAVGPHQHFERAPLDLLGLARIHKMPRRQNQRPRPENLGLPAMRKAKIDNGSGGTHLSDDSDLQWRKRTAAEIMVRYRPLFI